MKRFFASAIALAVMAGPATAEDLMYDYYSLLGPVDAYNSRGVPLDDFCAIVQQDRANWHKFNKREPSDGADMFFTNADRRALISRTCEYDRSYFANPGQRIRNGSRHFYIYVRVFGNGGQVSRVVITEGAG